MHMSQCVFYYLYVSRFIEGTELYVCLFRHIHNSCMGILGIYATFIWDLITHPCPNFNVIQQSKPSSKLRHGWILKPAILRLCDSLSRISSRCWYTLSFSVKGTAGMKILHFLVHKQIDLSQTWPSLTWTSECEYFCNFVSITKLCGKIGGFKTPKQQIHFLITAWTTVKVGWIGQCVI